MLNCKDATHLMSEAQERTLSMGEKLQLKLHLTLCEGCARFSAQLAFLRRACSGYLKRKGLEDDA